MPTTTTDIREAIREADEYAGQDRIAHCRDRLQFVLGLSHNATLVALSDDELATIRIGLIELLLARGHMPPCWSGETEDIPLSAGEINALGARLQPKKR